MTGALDGLACCAVAANGADNAQSEAPAAVAQVMTVIDRALFCQITADLSLAGGFFAVSALRVNRNEAEVGFEAIGIALDDLPQQFLAALCVAGFGEGPAKGELGHLQVGSARISPLCRSESFGEAPGDNKCQSE